MSEARTASAPFNFRKIAAFVAAAGTLFWLYTFYAIAHVPPGDGTGFRWLAVFPLGMIFGLFFLPAGCWSRSGVCRDLPLLLVFAA